MNSNFITSCHVFKGSILINLKVVDDMNNSRHALTIIWIKKKLAWTYELRTKIIKTISKTHLYYKKNLPLMRQGGSPLRVDLSAPRKKSILSSSNLLHLRLSAPVYMVAPTFVWNILFIF